MSMYPQGIGTIPAETMRVARGAYAKGTLAIRLRDELGGLYQDEQFGSLFPSRGQPAEAPWRLAIVVVLHSVEGLTDRQAAEAVRGRIDWKYALGLELADPSTFPPRQKNTCMSNAKAVSTLLPARAKDGIIAWCFEALNVGPLSNIHLFRQSDSDRDIPRGRRRLRDPRL